MKITTFFLTSICSFIGMHSAAQTTVDATFPQNNKLLYDNEELVYSFTTKNQKKVVIAKDRSNRYIQYRYGSSGKVELEFPKDRTPESWNRFQYNSYRRGGGKQNAGMEIDNLRFSNNGYTYLIYRTYFSEDDTKSAGIIITDPQNKEVKIKGIPQTIKGCICNLEHTGLIENTDIGLNF